MIFRPKLADVDQGLERVRGTFKRTVHHDSIEFGGIAVGIQGKRALTQRTPFSTTTLALTKNVVNNFVDILLMLDDPSLPLLGYLPVGGVIRLTRGIRAATKLAMFCSLSSTRQG